jgi:TM2 domain-containing membrane protein YozV
MDHCKKCGTPITPGATICHYCGISTVPVKKKRTAIILAFTLGMFGVHNFSLGYTKEGVGQLLMGGLCGLMTCGMATICSWIWAIYEGVCLIKGKIDKDGNRLPLIQ